MITFLSTIIFSKSWVELFSIFRFFPQQTLLAYDQFAIFYFGAFLLSAIALLFFILHKRNLYTRKENEAEYKIKLLEMEAKALTSQMNPHFIYNSLSTVQHLIMMDEKEKAIDYLTDFSLLMRQMLNNYRKSQIPLDDEIDFLNRYIQLEKFRFDNSFDYELNVEDDLKFQSCSIPLMLIQPILENAIKHGLAPRKEKGLLKIDLFLEKDILKCVVDDNGMGWRKNLNEFTSVKHESTALNIIKERLSIIKSYDNNTGKLEIIDKFTSGSPQSGTIIEIYIPIISSL
ncbi:MAG: sensor histidine kinase [Chitinophagaceae bacterium]